MTTLPDPERLLAEVWVQRLVWLEDQLRQGCPVEPLLRHAFHLAQLTPMRWDKLVGEPASEIGFEALLSQEVWDRAANLLLGDHVRIVRLTPTSGAMAVIVRCEHGSGSAIGTSFAEAALGAWIARMLDAVHRDGPSIFP